MQSLRACTAASQPSGVPTPSLIVCNSGDTSVAMRQLAGEPTVHTADGEEATASVFLPDGNQPGAEESHSGQRCKGGEVLATGFGSLSYCHLASMDCPDAIQTDRGAGRCGVYCCLHVLGGKDELGLIIHGQMEILSGP